jgi:hypothetical protein
MRGGFVVSQPEAIELGTIARSCTPASATGAIAYLRARVVSLTRMKQGSARCRECGDQTAYICEACVVSTRGPFTTESARIERRASESGVEETRIVVDAYWDDVGDFGGDAAELSTDWFPSAAIDETPISEMVKRIENSRA